MIYKKIKSQPLKKRNILLHMRYLTLSQYNHISKYYDFYAYFIVSFKRQLYIKM